MKWHPGFIGYFSAVCYFFGRELFRLYAVPIGLMSSSFGGLSWHVNSGHSMCFIAKAVPCRHSNTSLGVARCHCCLQDASSDVSARVAKALLAALGDYGATGNTRLELREADMLEGICASRALCFGRHVL